MADHSSASHFSAFYAPALAACVRCADSNKRALGAQIRARLVDNYLLTTTARVFTARPTCGPRNTRAVFLFSRMSNTTLGRRRAQLEQQWSGLPLLVVREVTTDDLAIIEGRDDEAVAELFAAAGRASIRPGSSAGTSTSARGRRRRRCFNEWAANTCACACGGQRSAANSLAVRLTSTMLLGYLINAY